MRHVENGGAIMRHNNDNHDNDTWNDTWAENKTRTFVTARSARLDELMTQLGCRSEIAPIDSTLFRRRAGEVIACVSRTSGPRWSDAFMLPRKLWHSKAKY